MIGIREAQPPFVQFETRAEVDRNESEQHGKVVYKNVDYALITPAGSRDVVERVATDWLKQKERDVIDGRFSQKYLEYYKACYEEWKKGNEIPVNGSPVKHWPVVSPAEIAQLTAANVRTVEELAELTESGLALVGMGGRALRDKARAWLDSAEKHGKIAEEVANLKEDQRRKDEQISKLQGQVEELLQRLNESLGHKGKKVA